MTQLEAYRGGLERAIARLPAPPVAEAGPGGGATERAETALELARSLAGEVGAFATLTPELALEQARRIERDGGGPLGGMPIAVKDVIDVAGAPTGLGAASGGRRPAASAVAVEAATGAGAVVIGKAATHPLAIGMVTPQARNPFDTGRIVGGSSGGSAAAVAAGICDIALGTDTNGSIRCPAALCGVVGLRPTFATVPTAGAAPLAPSQDTVGPIAASVAACAALHAVLTGAPPPDAPAPPAGLRVGVDRPAIERLSEPAVAAAVLAAVDSLRGAEIVPVTLPDLALAAAASFVTVMYEAAAAWAGEAPALGPQVDAALAAGAQVPAAAYLRAVRARVRLRSQLDALMATARLDAIATPSVPVVAAPAGVDTLVVNGRPLALEAAHARFLALAAVTGTPALSVPCGIDRGLPISLQLIGAPYSEPVLLRLAAAVEAGDGARAVGAARARLQLSLRKGSPDAR